MRVELVKLMAMALMSTPFVLFAQDTPAPPAEGQNKDTRDKTEKSAEARQTQEIVIRNKGDKELNLKMEIKGDEIMVNGKPLADFKDDQVTINKRKMIIRDGQGSMAFNFSPDVRVYGRGNGLAPSERPGSIRPFLGVTTEKGTGGAKIISVTKGSAAEKAGLKKDDVITKVEDAKIEDGESLTEAISLKKPKDAVKITYVRSGKTATTKATLGERKVTAATAYSFSGPRGNTRTFNFPGMSLDPNVEIELDKLQRLESMAPAMGFNDQVFNWEHSLTRQKKLGLKIQDTEEGGNVKVIEVEEGSAAEKAGLKENDIITEIGGVKINNTDEAREQLQPKESKNAYTIKGKRNGSDMSFEVKFPKKLKTASL